MNAIRSILVLAVMSAWVAAGAATDAPKTPAKTSTPQPLAPRFKQVRDRIADLYQHRNETPPAPDPALNPFRAPGSVIAPVGDEPVKEERRTPPVGNLALLQQAAATLKVSGTFEIGGKLHLVINARPYKSGDVVQTQVGGESVYLRVREISRRSVALALHDAEMTLNF
jgi:hypothetical protein